MKTERNQPNPLDQVEISGKKSKNPVHLVVAILVVASVASFLALPYSDYFSASQFWINDHLQKLVSWPHSSGKTSLSEKIKIITVDSKFYRLYGKSQLSGSHWQRLISAIAAQRPAKILTDLTFDLSQTDRANGLHELSKTLLPFKNLLVTPVDFEVTELSTTEHFEMREEFYLKSYLSQPGRLSEKLTSVDWMPSADSKSKLSPVLGPIGEFFGFLGHQTVWTDNSISPFIRLRRTQSVPHWSFAIAQTIKIESKQIVVNGSPLPLDWRKRIVVKTIPDELVKDRQILLSDWLVASPETRGFDLAADESIAKEISPGDFVLLLDLTGNALTEENSMRRATSLISMVHSIETKEWIQPIGHPVAAVALAAILGLLIAGFTQPLLAISATIVTALSLCVVGVLMQSLWDIALPWLLPAAAVLTTGVPSSVLQWRQLSRRTQLFRSALAGNLSPERLREMIHHPSSVQLQPTGRIVTVMFIDIVGFSSLSESQSPDQALRDLKLILDELSDEIHKRHGVVDRIIGDGLLAFFGYTYNKEEAVRTHALEALNCAISIQKSRLLKNLSYADSKKPFYGLRIGINTTSAYIGDLGNPWRMSPIIIGAGINYAKRLENVCRSYCIMVGGATRDMIGDISSYQPVKKLIRVKNHEDPFEAYEIDPFQDSAELRRRIETLHRNQIGLRTREVRWVVPPDLTILASTEFGDGILANFSKSGVAIILKVYLAPGLKIKIHLDSPQGSVRETIQRRAISVIEVEIAWARPFEDRYIHGCRSIAAGISADEQTFAYTLREAIAAQSKLGEKALNHIS